MVDLNDIAVFVKVAQFESFSRAARALGMPVSTVSRKVSALEAELGRHAAAKDHAQACAHVARPGLFQSMRRTVEPAVRRGTGFDADPKATGRVAQNLSTRGLGRDPFLEFISGFLKNYPRIKIDLFITNAFLDLIAENVDVGIRFGELKDSTLIAKRLGMQIRYVVAAPAYLNDRKGPTKPEDLGVHQCVLLSEKNNEAEWELVSGRKRAKVHVSGQISSRDFQSASTFVYRGHGIGFLPSTYCTEKIKKGELIRLLPEWASPRLDVHAVYPTRNYLPSRLHVFLEALKTWKSPLWTLS